MGDAGHTNNEGNYIHFPHGIKEYIKHCQREEDDRPYASRYIGSLVSDFHRNIIKGGIYMYPRIGPKQRGKLRLTYECNPIVYLTEQANLLAADGELNILDFVPTELHQREALFRGSRKMVETPKGFISKHD